MKRTFIALALLTIVLATVIVYSNSLEAPFQFDDVKRIVDIRAAQVLDLKEIFGFSKSRFLLYLTFALNFYFGKLDVSGYHILNLIIHIFSSLCVFWLCLLVFDSPRLKNLSFKKDRHLISFFSALIFALHPVQTESVTYIWQRAESMAGMFYLLSLVFYAKFRLTQIHDPHKKTHFGFYFMCLASMVLSSFTKPTAATLPAAILLYEICFLSKGLEDFKRTIRFLIPIFFLILIPLLLAKFDTLESKGVTVRFTAYYMPYYYTKLRVLVNALWLVIAPISQRIEYDFVMSSSLGDPISTFYSFLFHLVLILFAILSFRRYPLVTFCTGWFYIGLSITTILFLDDVFFEHYLYLPLFGYAMLLPIASVGFVKRMQLNRNWAVIFLVGLVAVYAVGTFNRNKVWQTEIALWEDAVSKSPRHARSNYTLGVYYFRAKRYEEAINRYKLALRYRPRYPEAYYRMGEYFFSLGKIESSIANYKKAIELKPDFFEAHLNLGALFLDIKDYQNARLYFSNALSYTKQDYYTDKINRILKDIP